MSSNTHGGNIYKFARQFDIAPLEFYDFSANINPLGMNERGKKAILTHIEECAHYPDPENTEVITAISRAFGIALDYITVGNGAAELLFSFTRLAGAKYALIPSPGFSEYKEAALASKLEIVEYELFNTTTSKSWSEQLLEKIKKLSLQEEDKVLLFIGNPNNPDGSLVDVNTMLGFLKQVNTKQILVLLDESFIDFTDGRTSMRPYIGKYDNLFILHSLTKILAIPGLRLGAFYGPKCYKQELESYIPTWSVNRLAQVYVTAALSDTDYIKLTQQYVQRANIQFYDTLCKYPFLEPIKPSVNFVLVKWQASKANQIALQTFVTYCEKRQILIRQCTSYKTLGDTWFRLAIKDETSNTVFFDTLKEFCDEYNLSC